MKFLLAIPLAVIMSQTPLAGFAETVQQRKARFLVFSKITYPIYGGRSLFKSDWEFSKGNMERLIVNLPTADDCLESVKMRGWQPVGTSYNCK